VDGHPSPAELAGADWTEIVPRSPLKGDAAQPFEVTGVERRFTHVRLNIFPDGGVARLRVHGEVVPDPRLLTGLTVDLAALENGARVVDCSNMFYSSPDNMLFPGLARNQAEGWETARRRDPGNDWAIVRLAAPGVIRLAEFDTTHLKFNAPGAVSLSGVDARGGSPDDAEAWHELLERTRLQPDGRHRFRLPGDREVTHVRVDIHPDGGLARLRLLGDLTPEGERLLTARWNELTR
jgi:allantoicase